MNLREWNKNCCPKASRRYHPTSLDKLLSTTSSSSVETTPSSNNPNDQQIHTARKERENNTVIAAPLKLVREQDEKISLAGSVDHFSGSIPRELEEWWLAGQAPTFGASSHKLNSS